MENNNYIRISVCIATYNGTPYIKEQISSILEQLSDNDEIIISDDGSTDETIKTILEFNDQRIKIYHHPKANNPWEKLGGDSKCFGVSSNFGYALKHAQGEYIFLSDQDDIWTKDRVRIILKDLQSKTKCCVICNYSLMNKNGIIYKQQVRPTSIKFNKLKSIITPPFMGCLLAFDRAFYNHIYPFPQCIPSHDFWIGFCALMENCLIIEGQSLHQYRTYGTNVSSNIHNSLLFKISYRMYILTIAIYRSLKSKLYNNVCNLEKKY